MIYQGMSSDVRQDTC